jgi:hypothetical protein
VAKFYSRLMVWFISSVSMCCVVFEKPSGQFPGLIVMSY